MAANDSPTAVDLQEVITGSRLQGLWRLMDGQKALYVAAMLLLGFAALSKTVTYLLLRRYADDVLGKGASVQVLLLFGASFVLLAVVEGALTFVSGRWTAETAERVAQRLRDYLFDHIQRLTFTYHDRMQTGELIQRCTSDLEAVRRFYAEQAIGMGRIVLLFVVNFAAIWYLSPQLAWISVVVIPILIIVSYFFFQRVSARYEVYQEQEATLTTVLQENLTGVRVVKAFARQAYERDKFEESNYTKFRRGQQLMLMHSLYWPASDILAGLQMVAGFTIAAVMAINGVITPGTYLAYAGMLVWLIWPMRNLGRLIVQTSTGLVSFHRVSEIIREREEPLQQGSHHPDRPLRGEIVFRDVSFSYQGSDAAVLRGISFRCAPGQTVALLGSTGSGKTSLVNLLPRFYDYLGGSITLDGVELKEYPRAYLRSQIGSVEQEPFLFSRTIRENIAYGVPHPVTEAEVIAAARAAAIHDSIVAFPEGYNTLVGEKGITLSGGQKQRVAIARAILRNPAILILDDATSSVDTETEGEIREALQRLKTGRTTFIIAHRIQTVMSADLILVLDKGEIVQCGDHAGLVAQPGIYRRIYDVQTAIEDALEKELAGAAPVMS